MLSSETSTSVPLSHASLTAFSLSFSHTLSLRLPYSVKSVRVSSKNAGVSPAKSGAGSPAPMMEGCDERRDVSAMMVCARTCVCGGRADRRRPAASNWRATRPRGRRGSHDCGTCWYRSMR